MRALRLAPLVVLAFVRVAAAQQPGGGPQLLSYEMLTKSPQGAWAEYVTQVKGQPQSVKLRYALVEKTAKRIALEVDGATPMGPMLMRMEYEPAGADAWKISRARMQMGTNPPQDVPVPPGSPPIKKGEEVGKPIGAATIKTPVGTFETKQYRRTMQQGPTTLTIDVWMSDKVLPVGLVKQADSEGKLTTTLNATGSGATTKMPAGPAPAKDGEAKAATKPAAKPAK